ncbi:MULTISPECIES: septum formation inhibitor Maf [unclassified Lentimonas]|uniref:septum formation inhibitor Maf n=1 Tax=unclassified Lentimonas TaxID=2630993 RepID=UPI001322362E|nr:MULTISPECIES: septum formation inhibitor Maf [unclassified Lentimonas]CAA6679190.1 Unannotated [Lentimonas sp. CC4]CAA6684066.1 Unannotated [Lentimonas sp. CC6]CAA6689818.1 Unannotated [Lentimonas sp. CC10]CAA6694827.1 Unannotated [Lentimonas sp. CC19]CAA7069480.1 Unannotated [Lentimonas sp. CC11]
MRLLQITLLSLFALNQANAQVREFWFSGAEINRYELKQMRYGESHPGHAELIFVTEPFLVDQHVKHEFGTGSSTDILKLNAQRAFNTGIYTYRVMTSTFQPIDMERYPHALKTNTSIQDWCGQVFQQIGKTQTGWDIELRSYFQKDGDQDFTLGDYWLEDELWTRLRLDPMSLPVGKLQLVPGAILTRWMLIPIEPQDALARLKEGKKQSSYTVEYPKLGRKLVIHFDTKFPHIIRGWEEHEPAGVTHATLTHRLMNSEYWSEKHLKDASKRKLLGLEEVPN